MKISVLAENYAGVYTRAEHGLSYFIEFEGKKILFDSGQSDQFLENANKMNLKAGEADFIVLSHGHFDHGNGLEYLTHGNLICHPECFTKRFRGNDKKPIGLKNTKDELSAKFNIFTSATPYTLGENAYFLGEIPRLTDFESKSTSFIFENGDPDFVTDDSAIALVKSDGLFIITGCGHAGIVNTIECAKKITGMNMVSGILGGLHLKEINLQTLETIRYLKENNVKHIMPSHCTELPALTAFYQNFGIRQIRTGDILEF
jgi:7,8-dihydropterin-6-yl-methyl-4-(beta-D-ribofuranosyl)aminobenzene 5'-phosphate synthase